jgi:benzoyl-CoA reductase/2-hydroxyglutaryl-CoA dehydratase subunit BcrC/BadD/HgdB
MDIVKAFGARIEALALHNPIRARRLLTAGYRAQRAALSLVPNRRLPPSRRYAARVAIDVVIRALARPDRAAMVSIFTPCEPLTVAGITPYSVETLSSYLAGTECGKAFLEHTAGEGIPETLCSFHRLFIGAADTGLMPKPRFVVYTNLACDGNMMTFPSLARKFAIPSFFIDVPYEKSEDAVMNVAGQLREMVSFVSDVTGKPIPEETLRVAVGRSFRTIGYYHQFLDYEKERRLPGDLTGEMYTVFMTHILLGTDKSEKYARMLLEDIRAARRSDSTRLLWIHLVPHMQPSLRQSLNFSEKVFVTVCDLAYESMMQVDAQADPYESMARRMVYSCYNGSPEGRIEQALEVARRTGADGAVIFAHWGCKSTLGASRLIKNALESEGLPTLILDGDGCDPSNSSDGQIATRMGAFLEMLGGGRR